MKNSLKVLAAAFFVIVLSATTSFAGFSAENDGTRMGEFQTLNIENGTPVAAGGKLSVDVDPYTITTSVGTEASNEIAITVTVVDNESNTVAADRKVFWWLSETAGAAPSGTAPDIDLTVSGGVSIIEHTANLVGEATTGSDGVFIITVGDDDADTDWYLNVVVADKVVSSGVVSHTA